MSSTLSPRLLEVLAGHLGVAAGVGLRVAGRRPRERAGERRERRPPAARCRDRAGPARRPRPSPAGRGCVEVARVRRAAARRAGGAPPTSRVRGSFASAPLPSRSFAISSMRSAWRSASSRTWRFCAMTASCGFGSRTAGRMRAAATSAAIAGRRASRGRNRPGSTARSRASGVAPLAADEAALGVEEVEALADRDRVVVVARRPDRRSSGIATANASAEAIASPAPLSASTASAVSPSDGRARTTRTRSTSSPTTGIASATCGAYSMGASRCAITSTSSDDRDGGQRRTRRGGRRGAATAGGGGAARPPRSSTSAGSSATPSVAGSAGTNGSGAGGGRAARPASRHRSVGISRHARRLGRGAAARMRQRRVGDTSWTARTMSTSDGDEPSRRRARPVAVARRRRSPGPDVAR